MDEPLKAYLQDLDRAIVARGGQSIYARKPKGRPTQKSERAFEDWEAEKLEYAPRDQDQVRSRGRVVYRPGTVDPVRS